LFIFFFQAEDGIRDDLVTGVQTCALPISLAISSRLIAASPARFLSCVNNSVSNECTRDVWAAPRSQICSDPISRKVGSWERRSRSEERRVGKGGGCGGARSDSGEKRGREG